ncbi:hypothetical protein JEU11_18895 [Paraglaciecola chathamensis]|uniref:Lipoprotein n=1 Tax=Paraglaciecola chathamensis TaxID=368405 RepID=A0ABS0WJ83_9ALTE|nr:hypothetical protein [Paraglaciecola chathamensis]MBJ2138527.1 hypothetical protein [Paraglaciecola chathamensis]
MKTLLIWVSIIAFCSGCSSTQPSKVTESKPELSLDKKQLRTSFVGKWESTQPTKDGNSKHAVIERTADGRYVVEFKIFYPDKTLKYQSKEFGFWGVSGGVYFTMFRGWIENDNFSPANLNNAYYYDAYKIVSVLENQLSYENLSSGNKYIYKRVL